MVRNSLQTLLDKWPYFLNKNYGSNFYKVQDVNNKSLRLMYNDLFQVYESFHLNKRLLIWKEQSVNFNYKIHFVANYPNIKNVTILKNDEPIYIKEYTLAEEKNQFDFTYICDYVKNYIPRVNVYRCENCGHYHLANTKPDTCEVCGEHDLHLTQTYMCNNCNQVYFSDTQPSICTICNHTQFNYVSVYRCSVCGQIYIGEAPPAECIECHTIAYEDINSLLYYNDEDISINDNAMIFDTDLYEETTTNTGTGSGTATNVDDTDIEPITDYTPTAPEDVPETIDDDEILKIPIPIITSDKFIITVTTHDEYVLTKGFPENDEPMGNEFDHDESLDEFGALNQIPRKTYIDISNPDLYYLTEPPYNNRYTEDDYHYMKRIIEYNLRLFNTPPPVLEIWKLYGLESTLLNRERLLLKMFDVSKHNDTYNSNEDLSECWKPEVWEHKDKFHECQPDLGEYFFAKADSIRPTLWQNVNISFKIVNSLAREIDTDYLVDIYVYLEEEGETTKRLLKRDHDKSTAIISYQVFSDVEKEYVLRFEAHHSDGTSIGYDEIKFKVRNCDDGDWYVSSTGNDVTGDGSSEKPFKTLDKAISVVNHALDFIIIKDNIVLEKEDNIPIVNTPCTIMGCDDASITSNYNRQFFHIVGERNITLRLVNLTLKNNELTTNIKSIDYVNESPVFTDYETVVIHGGASILTATVDRESYYKKDYIHITGTLKTKESTGIPNQILKVLIGDKEITNIVTNANGEFNAWVPIDLSDYTDSTFELYLNFDTENYFENTQHWTLNLMEPTEVNVSYGSTVRLVSLNNNPDEVVTFYVDNNPIGTATADSTGKAVLVYQPEWGTFIVYTFKDGQYHGIKDEWIITTYMDIDQLSSVVFLTDLVLDDNTGDWKAVGKKLTKIADLEGILTNVTFDDDMNYTLTKYHIPSGKYTPEELASMNITPEEYDLLKTFITSVTVDNTGKVSINKGV